MTAVESLYNRSPVFVQNMACSMVGFKERRLRYGGAFKRYLAFLEESQWWSRSEIEKYQMECLHKMLDHCYRNVPYYRKAWTSAGVKPADITTLADLQKLPVLKKEDIAPNVDQLISVLHKKSRLHFCHTSGTTGKSLHFYNELKDVQFQWAVWWRFRRRFGIPFDVAYATFTGQPVIPLNASRPPYWRYNRFSKQTIFTMHHILPDKVGRIVRRLNQGDFEYYSGYPSILYRLANEMIDQNLTITRPPKIIFTGVEKLFESQRALMSRVFGCPVTDQYGFSEGCGNASRCEQDLYHEDFEYGILECGEPMNLDAQTTRGKIIATGFANQAMPFVRYEVGDIGTWKAMECACGRKSRVLMEVDGRDEDFIITPEGARIMRFDHIFKDTLQVREAQIIQKEYGSIIVRLVRRARYGPRDEEYIRQEIKRRISPRLNVDFEYVREIDREATGKLRAVKNYIKDTDHRKP